MGHNERRQDYRQDKRIKLSIKVNNLPRLRIFPIRSYFILYFILLPYKMKNLVNYRKSYENVISDGIANHYLFPL